MGAGGALHEAAALMRARAGAAAAPENSHPYGDRMFPPATTPQSYGALMREYLGGEWGEQAASWHPGVALAVADWLDAAYAKWEFAESSLGQMSIRAMSGGINDPDPAALAVALAYLGAVL